MTDQLWAAVDALTKPSSMRIWRDERPAGDPAEPFKDLASQTAGWCDVARYRAATTSFGVISSLWTRAIDSLYSPAGEQAESTRSPLATRSVADVQLMTVVRDIREIVGEFNRTNDQDTVVIPSNEELPAALRHMASEVVRRGEQIELWAYRIAQLVRVLEAHLDAVDRGPKPMRLRVRCPRCTTEHVATVDQDGSEIVVRPILAIYRDGHLRCLECEACFAAWWPGDDIHALHAEIAADEERQRDLGLAG